MLFAAVGISDLSRMSPPASLSLRNVITEHDHDEWTRSLPENIIDNLIKNDCDRRFMLASWRRLFSILMATGNAEEDKARWTLALHASKVWFSSSKC